MVHRIDGGEATAATDGGYGRADLVAQQARIGGNHHAAALQKGLHLGRYVGGINGRTEQEAVGFHQLAEYRGKTIVFEHAVALPLAGEASAARQYLMVGQLYQFGFDAGLVESLEHLMD